MCTKHLYMHDFLVVVYPSHENFVFYYGPGCFVAAKTAKGSKEAKETLLLMNFATDTLYVKVTRVAQHWHGQKYSKQNVTLTCNLFVRYLHVKFYSTQLQQSPAFLAGVTKINLVIVLGARIAFYFLFFCVKSVLTPYLTS